MSAKPRMNILAVVVRYKTPLDQSQTLLSLADAQAATASGRGMRRAGRNNSRPLGRNTPQPLLRMHYERGSSTRLLK